MVTSAQAAGFYIVDANTRVVDNLYTLNARISYDFTQASLQALNNGVPLTIVHDIEVIPDNRWLWKRPVAALQQRFRLEYHALARQYLVINLNTGELKSFPTRDTALDFMGTIRDFPLLDASLLSPGKPYLGAIRARLDRKSLPAPLQIDAYTSADWKLGSGWTEWPL